MHCNKYPVGFAVKLTLKKKAKQISRPAMWQNLDF